MNKHSNDPILDRTKDKIVCELERRFKEASANFSTNRPVAKAAADLLAGKIDVSAEVKRLIGIDIDPSRAAKKPVLIVASKFGTWAAELTLVSSVLLAIGYEVIVATEDGTSPHLLGPSLDPKFIDGAWRTSVVSSEEQELAMRFLDPSSKEFQLLKPENIFDLSKLVKPPQVGDYLNDHTLLQQYANALPSSLSHATSFDAIVIAGGSGAIPGVMADRGLQNLLLAFNDLNKPIMGECNGGLVIAQTVEPTTGKSILFEKAVTTHSWLDEYQMGWGWTLEFTRKIEEFWVNGKFDLAAYSAEERWSPPGVAGNPLIDSESMFRNACGSTGVFFSPAGTPYSVVVDGNIITCRTTPDGYPGVLAMIAILDGKPALTGRFFIDSDSLGRTTP